MSNYSWFVLLTVTGSAIVCGISCYLNVRSNKRLQDSIENLHPYEKIFLFKREGLLTRINTCYDPSRLEELADECEAFLNEGAQMIDEIMYSQTIIDIEQALDDKQRLFTNK